MPPMTTMPRLERTLEPGSSASASGTPTRSTAIQAIQNSPQPRAWAIIAARVPVKLSETPGKVTRAAPVLGQHTEEILLNLGYDWEQLGDLRTRGVI